MPPTMISRFWDPSRSTLRAPTAPPRCGGGANRQLVIWGYAGICGLWLLSTRGTLYDPPPSPQATIVWGSQISQPRERCTNCPHAPGSPPRLLNYPHHAKIKPGLKPGSRSIVEGVLGVHGKITGVQECAPEGAPDCYKRRITKHARPKEYPKYSQACHTCHTRLCTAHGVFSDSRDSTRTEKLTKHAERRLCCCAQRATSGGLLGDTPAHSATHERAKPTGRRSISNLF
jgi:hypothetical protein